MLYNIIRKHIGFPSDVTKKSKYEVQEPWHRTYIYIYGNPICCMIIFYYISPFDIVSLIACFVVSLTFIWS